MFGIKRLAEELEKFRKETITYEIKMNKHKKEVQEQADRSEFVLEKIDENTERLNRMINELKGVVSQVRADAKK